MIRLKRNFIVSLCHDFLQIGRKAFAIISGMQSVSRLIEKFIPDSYTISLAIDRIGRKFSGTVVVRGSSTGADEIRLHSKGLEIVLVTLNGKKAEFHHEDNDELVITHPGLKRGEQVIVVNYSANITDAMHGIYPCYYEHDGIKKELIATQFESHHAREVFPCVDEPEAKAVFDVTLSTEQGVEVIGNMPIKQQTTENDLLVTTFEPSPKMSSYLVAFVIGELQRKSAQTNRGVDVSIWATPAQSSASLDFALDIAVRSIEYYESYFSTEYPLPKSDHVALPDFSSGAMENWGLVTYREVALLADPATTSISSKQYVASVIAHELAHQWFGNLVTMRWWNDLWLNESFATLMSYMAVDALEPSWNTWLDFSIEESILALRRDSIDGVQPVQVDVHHPDEIGTLFDGAIVYAKGSRLLRMLQHYVGDEAFQSALKSYFTRHAYSNTVATDLWNAVADVTGKDISELMNAWLSQPGYPVVSVAHQDDTSVTLAQKQFFVGPHAESNRLWPIPLDASDAQLPELFEGSEMVSPLSGSSLRLNQADSVHFITHYDDLFMDEILEQVKSGALDPLGRLQFLHEATLLARGGVMPSVTLLRLIQAYENETSEPVWNILFITLAEMRKFVENDEAAEKKLRALSGRIAKKQYERLGWTALDGESEDDTKLRATVISLTLYSEDDDAIATATKLYETTPLDMLQPELRSLIISCVTRHGDAKIVDDLLLQYTATSSSELRQDITVGITSTRIPQKIDQLLANITDASIIRPQDVYRWYVYLIRGKDSRIKTWQWVRDNWQWIDETFGSGMSYDMFPQYTASALSNKQLLAEYKKFFEPKKSIPALSRAITMGVSEIEGRIELIERDGPAVIAALKRED